VDVTLRTYEGMWHVWQLFAWAVPEGKMAIREMGEFVQRQWADEIRRTESEIRRG